MYESLTVWLAIIAAGVIGCIATGIAVQIATGYPMKNVAAHPGKQLWSIIFAIPLPFLLGLSSNIVGFFIAYLALALMPSIASKLYFGPKEVPFSKLMIFNGIYALAAIGTFVAVVHLF